LRHVRCIRNKTLWKDDAASTYEPLLIVGHVYKVAPPAENDSPEWLRIINEEGEDYLYPADYFEPYALDSAEHATETITVHLAPSLKHILHAEALAAQASVSGLLRQWIDDHLDLPA
jgi:hypothetical protein